MIVNADFCFADAFHVYLKQKNTHEGSAKKKYEYTKRKQKVKYMKKKNRG
jgi:hypothetical protein